MFQPVLEIIPHISKTIWSNGDPMVNLGLILGDPLCSTRCQDACAQVAHRSCTCRPMGIAYTLLILGFYSARPSRQRYVKQKWGKPNTPIQTKSWIPQCSRWLHYGYKAWATQGLFKQHGACKPCAFIPDAAKSEITCTRLVYCEYYLIFNCV